MHMFESNSNTYHFCLVDLSPVQDGRHFFLLLPSLSLPSLPLSVHSVLLLPLLPWAHTSPSTVSNTRLFPLLFQWLYFLIFLIVICSNMLCCGGTSTRSLTHSFVLCSSQLTRNTVLHSHILNTSIILSSFFRNVQLSEPYSAILHTNTSASFTFNFKLIVKFFYPVTQFLAQTWF